jgi:hypothetical protein
MEPNAERCVPLPEGKDLAPAPTFGPGAPLLSAGPVPSVADLFSFSCLGHSHAPALLVCQPQRHFSLSMHQPLACSIAACVSATRMLNRCLCVSPSAAFPRRASSTRVLNRRVDRSHAPALLVCLPQWCLPLACINHSRAQSPLVSATRMLNRCPCVSPSAAFPRRASSTRMINCHVGHLHP